MSEFVNINYVNFEEHINNGLVLIDFWAEWCTACVAQDKYFDKLKSKFENKISICKLNVSDNRLLSDKFGVRNIPYIILLKNGEEIMRMPGIQDEKYLIGIIEDNLD